MKLVPMFDPQQVQATAAHIANEMRPLLSHTVHTCSTHELGLTNGEKVVAKLRALTMLQLILISELCAMTTEIEDDLLDEGEAA